jgi:6-phospho-3-hexuloisomerase
MALSELSRRALSDLSGVFSVLPDTAADPLIEAIASARRIALYGAGREGLALRGAMHMWLPI